MNYKVLYRKYRPNDFDNLIGQENIVKILKNSIMNRKLSHAYIFSGPRGTGKTSSAKIFAKNINCLHNENGISCGDCLNCKEIENSSDIIEIDAASNNGVDEIREIINNIKLVPSMMKYKVYIIDEVHMLSTSAFNALLLTLEEPPSHVIFILATTNIESVPITILSRCQRFDFKKITTENIVNRLNKVCELEDIKIETKALELIAKISDGGLRDSLSLLDQLSKENEEITEDIVLKYSGNISDYVIKNILELLDQNNFIELEKSLDNLFSENIDYKLFIKGLICEIANIVKNKILKSKETRLNVESYKKLILDLTDFQNKINVSVEVYSILTVILFSYIDFNEKNINSVEIIEKNNEFVKKINTSEEKISAKPVVAKKIVESISKDKDNFNKIRDIRINNCFAQANKDEKLKVIPIWDEYIKESNTTLRGYLVDTSVAMCSNDIITISFERENDLDEIQYIFENFQNDFNKLTKLDSKLVLVSKEYWNELVIKYKNDRDSGIIYSVKDEAEYLDSNNVDVGDIFDNVEEI